MGIFLGDIRVKSIIELGLDDISKNQWILNDILGDTISSPYLRERYGNQIESCRQWLANNKIGIYMSALDNKIEFPAIVIEMGNSNEKPEMKSMGDFSTESVRLLANDINKPIPYIVKPSTGLYNASTGVFTFTGPANLLLVSSGMILVDPPTGNGYEVLSIISDTKIQLLVGLAIVPSSYGIIPQFQYYDTKIGRTFMQETYKITCNGLDQQTLLWMHSIVSYSLLRYRQSLLEAGGFAENLITSGGMYPNQDYSDNGQVIWSRDINLTGQVENTFYMQPHRVLETLQVGNGAPAGVVPTPVPVVTLPPGASYPPGYVPLVVVPVYPAGFQSIPPDAFVGGIKIVSNKQDTEDLSQINWSTVED